jgi:hypothetical protein
MSPDPWTTFLDWLTSVFVPSWGELIGLMPYAVVLFVVGPIVTIIVLLWAWYLVNRSRGRVRRGIAQPVPAPRGDDGSPVFPPNQPYCEQHALVYPPRSQTCSVDDGALLVSCPVDGTIRDAEIDICSACGTRFELGAKTGSAVVLSSDGPPTGGAAIA